MARKTSILPNWAEMDDAYDYGTALEELRAMRIEIVDMMQKLGNPSPMLDKELLLICTKIREIEKEQYYIGE